MTVKQENKRRYSSSGPDQDEISFKICFRTALFFRSLFQILESQLPHILFNCSNAENTHSIHWLLFSFFIHFTTSM